MSCKIFDCWQLRDAGYEVDIYELWIDGKFYWFMEKLKVKVTTAAV